jgi:DNA-binding SARP family transcriptional activator
MADSSAPRSLAIDVLGLIDVRVDGRRIDIPVGLTRRVLLALVIARHRGHTDLELIERLWGASAPPTALASLRNTVVRVRTLLGADAIERTPRGYRVRSTSLTVDVDEFDEQVAWARRRAAAGLDDEALLSLRRALTLVRGRPYVEVADEWWAASAAADVAERIAAAEELWAEVVLRSKQSSGEIARLQRAARAMPHREVRWKQLTRALLAADRRVDAARAVHEARAALAEFGLDVSAELAALEAAALDGRTHHGPVL